jgi:hypothetical protein
MLRFDQHPRDVIFDVASVERGARVALVLLLGLALGACFGCVSDMPEPGLRGSRVLPRCDGTADSDRYFPLDTFRDLAFNLDGSARADYAAFLQRMREPSLYCGPREVDSYRLLRLARGGTPLAVRIDRAANGATVTVAKLEAPTWLLPPGELVESRRHDISESQWSGLVGAIEAAGFWRLETSEKSMMNDGDPLIVEARRGEVYHVVERLSPARGGSFHTLAAVVLQLAQVTEESVDPGAPGVRVRLGKSRPRPPAPPHPPGS